MPNFDIIKKVCPKKTFRVSAVMGKFDLLSNEIQERFIGNIDLPSDWQIGLIVGKSGTGKTTISKQLFPQSYITAFDYNSESILDDMPKKKSIEEITRVFNSVGFSSPPSWLKPYCVLSNGEKMRVDLANAMLRDDELFVFDEFTSVVDRQVAKIGSFAMQKAIRKTTKKFIAVGCHFDIEDWLLPDWTFNTDTMNFSLSQKKNRPEIKFRIFETKERDKYWRIFSRYHYLSHNHINSARIFVALIDNEVSGFISVMHFMHNHLKNMKKVHRLVVLPDYQGLGIGNKLLNEVAKIIISEKNRLAITTSSPSLIFSLKNQDIWKCKHFGRMSMQSKQSLKKSNSNNRITTTFEYCP